MPRQSKYLPPSFETIVQLGEIFSAIAVVADRQIGLLCALKLKKAPNAKKLPIKRRPEVKVSRVVNE